MGKMTDNLLKYITAFVSSNAGTTTSTELDLDIPRGYVAKIHRIILSTAGLEVDLLDQTGDFECSIAGGLYRDPDDSVSVTPPSGQTQHDALAYLLTGMCKNNEANSGTQNASTGMQFYNTRNDSGWFPDHLDMITARNLRFNIDQFGANKSALLDSGMRVEVYFTYEKVSASDIAELLDIL